MFSFKCEIRNEILFSFDFDSSSKACREEKSESHLYKLYFRSFFQRISSQTTIRGLRCLQSKSDSKLAMVWLQRQIARELRANKRWASLASGRVIHDSQSAFCPEGELRPIDPVCILPQVFDIIRVLCKYACSNRNGYGSALFLFGIDAAGNVSVSDSPRRALVIYDELLLRIFAFALHSTSALFYSLNKAKSSS